MADPTARAPLLIRGLPLLLILVALLLFFAPGLFFGQVYFFRDLGMEIVPKRQFFSDHHGLVLWNPYVFAGEPFAANPQSSAFYPLSLLWLLGPAEVVLGPYLVLHFLLAGIFAYCFFLELGLKRTSALAGSLALTLGGGFASLTLQVVNLNSAAWIPGILWLGIRMQRGRSLRPALGLGIFIALQILGGEPEICYLTLLALSAYLLFTGAMNRAPTGSRHTLVRPLLLLALALLIGLGLSAIQWVLTMEMTGLSNRASGFALAEASAYSLEVRDLISILVPHYLLDPSSKLWGFGFWSRRLPYFLSIYPGIIGLLLIPFAFRSERRREVIFWTGVALFSLLLALGPDGYLYSWAHRWLPGFDRFRFPERALLGFALAAAVLAALGLEALPEQLRRSGTARALFLTLPVVVILALVLGLSLSGPLLPFPQLMPDLFLRSGVRSLLFALVFFLLLGLLSRAPQRQRFLPVTLAFLLVGDLFLAHRWLNPTTERSLYTFKPPWVSELKENRGPVPSRVFIAAPPKLEDQFLGRNEDPRRFYQEQREWLQPFFALRFGIPDLHAKSSFYLALQKDLNELLDQADSRAFLRLLAIFGVEKIAVPSKGVRLIPNALPRAYLAFAERRAESHDQARQILLNQDWDPWKEVVLEGETASPPLVAGAPIQAVTIKTYANEHVELLVRAGQPAWLVLLDSFYPGWQARVDQEPVPIRQANGFFRAVRLNPGSHQITFRYQPSYFFLALGITLGTSGLVGLLLMLSRWPRKGGLP